MVSYHLLKPPHDDSQPQFTALLVVALYYLAFAAAVVLPTSAVLHLEDLADPPQPTEPPAQTGPICTLVDGGDTGGTFCNLWTGNGSITDTNWVSTGKIGEASLLTACLTYLHSDTLCTCFQDICYRNHYLTRSPSSKPYSCGVR